MRTRNLPCKVSEDELTILRDKAKREGEETLSIWIRRKLGLSTDVRPGAPKGRRNNPAGRRGKGEPKP